MSRAYRVKCSDRCPQGDKARHIPDHQNRYGPSFQCSAPDRFRQAASVTRDIELNPMNPIVPVWIIHRDHKLCVRLAFQTRTVEVSSLTVALP